MLNITIDPILLFTLLVIYGLAVTAQNNSDNIMATSVRILPSAPNDYAESVCNVSLAPKSYEQVDTKYFLDVINIYLQKFHN